MVIEPRPISKQITLLTGAVCSLFILTGVVVGAAAMLAGRISEGERPNFIFGGFELIVAVAGWMGVWLVWKKREEHAGMALLCVGGTVCVASFLGALSAQNELLGHGLKPLMLARVAMGLLIAALGGVCVLGRHERSWPLFWKGVFAASPIFVMTAYAIVMRILSARFAAVTPGKPADPNDSPVGPGELVVPNPYTLWGPLETSPTAVKAIVGTLIAIVCAVSLCACVHIFIKAFELGRFSRERVALPKKK